MVQSNLDNKGMKYPFVQFKIFVTFEIFVRYNDIKQ